MSTIQDYLNQIKNAIYGKDVRQAIHDGIQQCYYDGHAGAIDLSARQRLDTDEANITSLTSRMSTAETDIDVLDSRVDQIVAPSGEAPSAAEVSDARVGADGTIYTSLGDAVRGQVSDVKSALSAVENLEKSTVKSYLEGWTNGRIMQNSFTASNDYAYSDTYPNDLKPIYFDDSVYKVGFCYFDEADNDPTDGGAESIGSWVTTSPATNTSSRAYYRLSITKKVTSAVDTSDITAYAKVQEYTSLVKTVIDIDETVGVKRIDVGDFQNGYYSNNNGTIKYNAHVNSKAYVVDLSEHIGSLVNVLIDTTASTSTRLTALCDADGVISESFTEDTFVNNAVGHDYYPNATYKYLYISYTNSLVSDFSATAYSEMGEDVKKLMDNYSPKIVFVDGTSGSDSNNGLSRSNAFATIQKAVDSKAKNILVREGTYDVFAMSNASDVTISLDHYYDTFTVISDEDNPKIVIDGQSAENTGIELTNCSNVKICNFEVKDCVVSGIYLYNCSAISLLDCIAHDIYKSTKDAVSYGFRFVSADCDCYNCLAYNIGTDTTGAGAYLCDGFNIHVTGTVNLFNCSAYNCEDDGVSHHDACCGVVDGGEWHHCGKGGVASPTHGAKVNVQNVYSHDNDYGLYAGNSDAVTDRGNILISNCVFKNNTQKDIFANSYYKLIVMNCIYDTSQATNMTVFGQ